jgi:hypothetical protein
MLANKTLKDPDILCPLISPVLNNKNHNDFIIISYLIISMFICLRKVKFQLVSSDSFLMRKLKPRKYSKGWVLFKLFVDCLLEVGGFTQKVSFEKPLKVVC